MFEKVYLTELDQEMMDPTGKIRARLKTYKEGKPTPVPYWLSVQDWRWWFESYKIRLTAIPLRHSLYREWSERHLAKCGPQGDPFPISELEHSYQLSYQLAERKCQFNYVKLGRDFLIRTIRQLIERVGYPQAPEYYSYSTEATFGGIPVAGHKGDFLVETVGMKPHRHVQPDVPGERSQRLKHRCINMDATSNVRYIERTLKSCREWLKLNLPQYFSAWLNPDRHLRPQITDRLRKGCISIEGDYSHCDEAFGWDIVSEVVLPIYEQLIPDPMQFILFASFVEELFEQPVYMGDYMLTGHHNLLSGQVITNDFETIYDICLEIGVAIASGWSPLEPLIAALGDDTLVLTTEHPLEECLRYRDNMVEEVTRNGEIMNTEKCAVVRNSVRFLRTLYYPGLSCNHDGNIIGAYPGSLCINSIVCPERYTANVPEAIKATVQKLDNVRGTPEYHPMVDFVFSRVRRDLRPTYRAVAEAQYYDWWERVYGEAWTASQSPTFQYLLSKALLND